METKGLYKGEKSSELSGHEVPVSTYSNQTVLMITCASFLVFVIAEIIGAIVGNSWALLGDAAAMSVDADKLFYQYDC